MKVLFISSNLLNSKNGGWQCSNRNYESIREIASSVDVYHITPNAARTTLMSLFLGILNLIKLYSGGINKKHIKIILNKISEENYDLVFFDSSVYGKLVRAVKRNFPNLKLVSFYHNVEYDFIKKLIYTGGFLHIFRIPACFRNEQLTAKWSDQLICLTQEDEKVINNLYTKKTVINIPISFKPIIEDSSANLTKDDGNISLLFVGSYFYANIQGIKWFVDNVKLPSNVKLTIVGKDMQKLRSSFISLENVKIYSNVENLSVFYSNAHAVICPLFYGGGMKVKVAEALMHGKKVIGTDLAFYGYRSEECSTMLNASTSEDYLQFIENLNVDDRYFEESFNHFNQYFSYTSTLELFRNIINKR